LRFASRIDTASAALLLNDRLEIAPSTGPRTVSAGVVLDALRMPSSDGLVVPRSVTSLSRMRTFSTQMPVIRISTGSAFASTAACTLCPALQFTLTLVAGRGALTASGTSGTAACAAAEMSRHTIPKRVNIFQAPFRWSPEYGRGGEKDVCGQERRLIHAQRSSVNELFVILSREDGEDLVQDCGHASEDPSPSTRLRMTQRRDSLTFSPLRLRRHQMSASRICRSASSLTSM